jgi:hypothetical protein
VTVDNRTSLLDLLREHFGLTGSKKGSNATGALLRLLIAGPAYASPLRTPHPTAADAAGDPDTGTSSRTERRPDRDRGAADVSR